MNIKNLFIRIIYFTIAMIRTIAFFFCLTFLYTAASGQTSTTRTMVVVDSITVPIDRDQSIHLLQEDIANVSVIKQADSLAMRGFAGLDSAVYIFTKEYEKRPDSIRKIASTKQMETKKDSMFLNGIPYTGKFIDYYFSGLKQAEGTYKNGRLTGRYKSYYRNGKIATESNYIDTTEEVFTTGYYPNGSIFYTTQMKNGKPKSISEDYFLNGQLSNRTIFTTDGRIDTTFVYYSSGKIKDKIFFEKGKWISKSKETNELLTLSDKSYRKGDKKQADKYLLKAINLDSSNPDAYFARARINSEELNWKAAIADFDKTLKCEPYFLVASVYRAFAIIKYYESLHIKRQKNRPPDNVMAPKVVSQIPIKDKEKLCIDLQAADQFIFALKGISADFIADALLEYCQIKSSR